MKFERLLLCRPHGGLNDILCQIEKSCRYAERFGRTVVVDTQHGALEFADTFSKYFVSTSRGLILSPSLFAHLFDRVSVAPSNLAGRVTHYRVAYDAGSSRLFDGETGGPLTFDFDRDYSENLLVHQAFGGGDLSLPALARMRIHESIIDVLGQRMGAIGKNFDAIHVRDTDYQTDYRPPLRDLKDKLSGSVFVASDNRNVVDFCRTLLGEDRVFSFSKLPDEAGHPLHLSVTGDVCSRNRDAIVDLLMLSLSQNYYFFQIRNPNYSFSGFSLLARNLKEKPELLKHLLGRYELIFNRHGSHRTRL